MQLILDIHLQSWDLTPFKHVDRFEVYDSYVYKFLCFTLRVIKTKKNDRFPKLT